MQMMISVEKCSLSYVEKNCFFYLNLNKNRDGFMRVFQYEERT